MFFTVYKTTNLVNGHYYVGSHKTLDPNDDYLGSGDLLLDAVKKYGREKFKKEVICMALCEEWLEPLEDTFIVPNEVDPKSYNINPFGTRPPSKRTEEHKRNIGLANRGNKRPDLVAYNSSNERRKELSERRIGTNNPFFNKKHNTEYKIQQSRRNKGKNNPMYGSTYIQINNGKINKRWSGKEVPDGWVRGWLYGTNH